MIRTWLARRAARAEDRALDQRCTGLDCDHTAHDDDQWPPPLNDGNRLAPWDLNRRSPWPTNRRNGGRHG